MPLGLHVPLPETHWSFLTLDGKMPLPSKHWSQRDLGIQTSFLLSSPLKPGTGHGTQKGILLQH